MSYFVQLYPVGDLSVKDLTGIITRHATAPRIVVIEQASYNYRVGYATFATPDEARISAEKLHRTVHGDVKLHAKVITPEEDDIGIIAGPKGFVQDDTFEEISPMQRKSQHKHRDSGKHQPAMPAPIPPPKYASESSESDSDKKKEKERKKSSKKSDQEKTEKSEKSSKSERSSRHHHRHRRSKDSSSSSSSSSSSDDAPKQSRHKHKHRHHHSKRHRRSSEK